MEEELADSSIRRNLPVLDEFATGQYIYTRTAIDLQDRCAQPPVLADRGGATSATNLHEALSYETVSGLLMQCPRSDRVGSTIDHRGTREPPVLHGSHRHSTIQAQEYGERWRTKLGIIHQVCNQIPTRFESRQTDRRR